MIVVLKLYEALSVPGSDGHCTVLCLDFDGRCTFFCSNSVFFEPAVPHLVIAKCILVALVRKVKMDRFVQKGRSNPRNCFHTGNMSHWERVAVAKPVGNRVCGGTSLRAARLVVHVWLQVR